MVEKIPEAAFREAIANALIHRVWDINSHIRVSMFDDRIESSVSWWIAGGNNGRRIFIR